MKRKKNLLRRAAAWILCLTMAGSISLAGCGTDGGQSTEETASYSVWITQSEDSTYYESYDKNPSIEYLLTKTWGPENKKVDLDFLVPVAGAEMDNFKTLLSTGDYPDMMDATMYDGSIVDLYEQGIVLDLTDYIDQYMPNYKAFLEQNPDLANQAAFVVNGEKKYLTVRNMGDEPPYNWGGYIYRRDWIIKYGKNPLDGSTFSGSYTGKLADGSVDKETWEDNVVFPSGQKDPLTISDWEWMLEIFSRAIQDLNITDGYCMSLYYPGYLATGDLVCAFGGGGPMWYRNKDGQIAFGGTEENFRVYLQAMNTWYRNGWIDKAFPEHTADMFYRIDDAKVRSGKIGLWLGIMAQLEGKLDDGEGLKAGMVNFAASQPINDKYGSAEQQNVEPYTMYQIGQVANRWIITDAAKDKDLVPLLSMLDYMYAQEGALLGSLGLNKEQYEVTKNELYTRYGLTEGAYYEVPEEQRRGTKRYAWVDTIQYDGGMLQSACKCNRFFFLSCNSLILTRGSDSLLNNYDQWIRYQNTGGITDAINNQLTPDEQKTITKIHTNVNEFMQKTVPAFIKGEKDPFSDADWEAYVKALNKYSPDKATQIYQEKLDSLK